MERFKIYTLIDITESKQNRKEPGKEIAWQQQQNFQMLLQTIGLRVNPVYHESPSVEFAELSNFNFGDHYKGSHRVWTFEFISEYDGALTDSFGRQEGLLIEDLHFVPVITDLTETATLNIPIFNSKDSDFKNILVYTV